MRKLLSLLMGQNECASPMELRKQYQRVTAALFACEIDGNPEQSWRFQTARERLALAFEKSRNQLAEATELHGSVTGSGLLLGEILVDSEVITKSQLDDALKAQAESKPPLPLGRILVARKLLTWEQLAYYLKLQDLLQLPPTNQHRLARQLMELGLASRAEIDVAELDCETTGCSMFHAVTRRGWVKPSLLAALTNTPDKSSAGKDVNEERPAAKSSTNFVPV